MFNLQRFTFLFVIIIIFLRKQNVFSSSSYSHCADIFSSKNFKGERLALLDEVGWAYRGHLKLFPNSVKIIPSCSLTMFDGKGNIQTIREDVQNLSWVNKNPVHSTCCHCGSCDKLKTSLHHQCARIFHHENCNSCEAPLDVSNDQEIEDFHLIRNKIGSVIVRDRCQLDVYYEVTGTSWKILMKANLKSGNNFVETFNIFNQETTVSVGKAVCSCNNGNNKSTSIFSEPYATVDVHAEIRISDSDMVNDVTIGNPDSKESVSVSSSSESYKDQDLNDEEWLYENNAD